MQNLNRAVRSVSILALALVVVGCNSKNDSKSPPSGGGGVVVTQQEDQLGTRFGTAFRAANDSEPYSPADGDVVAISLTTEPVDIK